MQFPTCISAIRNPSEELLDLAARLCKKRPPSFRVAAAKAWCGVDVLAAAVRKGGSNAAYLWWGAAEEAIRAACEPR